MTIFEEAFDANFKWKPEYYNVDVRRMKELFRDWQPPKEKVKIPEFVADYIESEKANGTEIYFAFESSSTSIEDWIKNNPNDFYHAWLEGYDIEKEKRYYLTFPTKGDNIYVLNKDFAGWEDLTKYKSSDICSFTEQEIKDIDERLWSFAEEVSNE